MIGLYFRLTRGIPEAHLRREYRRRFWRVFKVHKRPGLLLFYLFHLAMHYHTYTMARNMATNRTAIVNSY
jgi:hypothetical protein